MVNVESQPSIHCQTEIVEVPNNGQRQLFRHYERQSQELEYFSAIRSNCRNSTMLNVICFICGRSGHIVRQCPRRQQTKDTKMQKKT
jgi:hypothetical protein